MKKKQLKTMKNQGKNELKIDVKSDEIELENDENEEENDYNPLIPDESEEQEVLFDIKKELANKGIKTTDDAKFILKKKNNRNQFAHCKTFYGTMPEIDEIGEMFRGGEYMVMVHANGRYQFSKTFPISTEAYPPLDTVNKTLINNHIHDSMTERESIHERRLDEMREEIRQREEEAKQKNNDMMNMFISQMNETNKMMMTMIMANNNKSSSLDDLIKIMTAMKSIEGSKENTFDYNRVFDIVGSAFQNGLQLAMQMIEKKDDENIGDVLVNIVKGFAKNINPATMLASATNNMNDTKQITSENKETKNETTAKQLMSIIQEYFNLVKLGYETNQDIDYFVHLACKTNKFKIIKIYADKFDNNTLEQFIAGTGFKELISDENFRGYILDILDNIREYDKISSKRQDYKENSIDNDKGTEDEDEEIFYEDETDENEIVEIENIETGETNENRTVQETEQKSNNGNSEQGCSKNSSSVDN